MNLARELCLSAAREGYTLIAFDADPCDYDYKGKQPLKCLEALEACDLMQLLIEKEGARSECALIVNEAGFEHENVADCSAGGFIEAVLDRCGA